MKLSVSASLRYRLDAPADMLLLLEADHGADQIVSDAALTFAAPAPLTRVAADEMVGERVWLRAEGEWFCDYRAHVEILRVQPGIAGLPQVPVRELPADTIKYLMPSRYCPADTFHSFVLAEFDQLSGGARIAEMRRWIEERFIYEAGASMAQTTAVDTFVSRRGVCRDFAHVLISMARASSIPARMASAYALGVEPQDFHAVVEVFLDGAWRIVDPTGMTEPENVARIGVGRDAADIAFMTIFGNAELVDQNVMVAAATDRHSSRTGPAGAL